MEGKEGREEGGREDSASCRPRFESRGPLTCARDGVFYLEQELISRSCRVTYYSHICTKHSSSERKQYHIEYHLLYSCVRSFLSQHEPPTRPYSPKVDGRTGVGGEGQRKREGPRPFIPSLFTPIGLLAHWAFCNRHTCTSTSPLSPECVLCGFVSSSLKGCPLACKNKGARLLSPRDPSHPLPL